MLTEEEVKAKYRQNAARYEREQRDQPKEPAQQSTDFFADDTQQRPAVANDWDFGAPVTLNQDEKALNQQASTFDFGDGTEQQPAIQQNNNNQPS